MNNIPAVSVIVPVYKAEKYLHRCVDSLLAQTFRDFEVLLVDDGSPDRSGELCDEYAARDPRVRVFHKENGGVSSARQCGLDHAQGEYTIHADPDDWVEPTMLEELYRKAKEVDADMVICDYYEEFRDRTIYKKQQPTAIDRTTVLRELFQQLHGSCCNKLVKRACYNSNDVKFPSQLSFCEDLYVNTSLLLRHKEIKIDYLPKAFYHYVQDVNPNSIVRKKGREDFTYCSKLYDMFVALTSGSSCASYCQANMAWITVKRAFVGHYFTSKEFVHNCSRYAQDVYNYSQESFLYKVLLYISCRGGYGLCYFCLQIKRFFKFHK